MQTLQKMIDQLKKGSLNEDQLKKMLEEVDKAVKRAVNTASRGLPQTGRRQNAECG